MQLLNLSLVIVPFTESLKVHYGKAAMLEQSKHLTLAEEDYVCEMRVESRTR